VVEEKKVQKYLEDNFQDFHKTVEKDRNKSMRGN